MDRVSWTEGNPPTKEVFVSEQTVAQSERWWAMYESSGDRAFRLISKYKSGGAPSDAERSILKAFEEDRNTEITSLEAKKRELEKVVEDAQRNLTEHCKLLQQKRAAAALSSAVGAPIRRLPTEMLCRIMRLCIPDYRFRRSTKSNAPFIFLRVCKYWREVALKEPTLWNRARFTFDDLQDKADALACSIRYHRKASSDIPLELAIVQEHASSAVDLHPKVNELLAKAVASCKHLSISVSTESNFWVFVVAELILPEQLQTLRSISLDFRMEIVSRKRAFPSLLRAPNLRHVQLKVASSSNLNFISLPYGQIKHLSTVVSPGNTYIDPNTAPVMDWRALVSKCLNLEEIEVYFQGRGYTNPREIQEQRLKIPSLSSGLLSFESAKRLSIRVGFGADIDTVLKDFFFPKLRYLHLSSVSHPITLFAEHLPFAETLTNHMLMFTLSGLTALSLLRVSFVNNELRELLRFTPFLTSLDVLKGHYEAVEFVPDDCDIVQLFTVIGDQPNPVLCRLRDLTLYFHIAEDLSLEENINRYAALGVSRYLWAEMNLQTRDLGLPSDMELDHNQLPSYPFRLYLQFTPRHWLYREEIRRVLGSLSNQVFWPGQIASFAKAG
ncbi:hypothetical protein NLJ89_g10371 [Agrocybe chaxingu]|uniref:F-box domain-containing protein n=1 Tax=Agrocybe chaxingu TaxID=84603 RepID=A0A9W8JYU0_9AGAR|nr:hypothetical protein NLJ89_g10371 [Agrocybe chaxingu]